ncbi:hypothetical protein [Chroococcidiopsis sp. CCMEE 29]|uniref:nuclear transport factor 2 family protein n=1 Tax=Chroococcidiopsis sp. CCMEE 29 TaxID=155894 RepID=UPI002021C621|nr:hypothetical protein [Chroococcidiopsis sp. CCMEE 29]
MSNAEKAQAFFDAYTAHDIEGMLALCSQAATFRYVPLGESGTGSVCQEAVGVWRLYIDVFPNFHSEVVSLREGREGSVTCEIVNSGTQAKDIGNIQNKSRSFYAPHLYIFDFDDQGLIEKITCYWDNDTIYAQLGHTEQHN